LKYNGHKELKSSQTGGTMIMTKGRKTSFDERIEIVQYCIEHDHNYTKTAERYKISYQVRGIQKKNRTFAAQFAYKYGRKNKNVYG
jgi:aryl-alcohol dehydrogenase-like predicted oxidoreductase